MTSPPNSEVWDVELRPHRTPLFVYAAAFSHRRGAHRGGLAAQDQVQRGDLPDLRPGRDGRLGLVIAGVVLLFARPRLRVGPAGLSVRNLLGDRLMRWHDVVGVSFPVGNRWARIDLPDDEYIPVMAIQAVDKDRAVDAMDTVRSLLARYRPDLHTP